LSTKFLETQSKTTCLCCLDFGIACYQQDDCRQVISRNGLGPAKVPAATTIKECLAGSPHSETHGETGWHQRQANEWLNALEFSLKNPKIKKVKIDGQLNEGETRGYDSEIEVAQILADQSLLPWIVAIERQEHYSKADHDGIDIILKLSQEIALLLRSDTIRIQVKSNPKYFKIFLVNLAGKRKVAPSEVDQIILNECFIFLNGGAGMVTTAGVVVPFVIQLHRLICLRNSQEAGDQFWTKLNPFVLQQVQSLQANGVLERDYDFILNRQTLQQSPTGSIAHQLSTDSQGNGIGDKDSERKTSKKRIVRSDNDKTNRDRRRIRPSQSSRF